MFVYMVLNVIFYTMQNFLGKLGVAYLSPMNLLLLRYLIYGIPILLLFIFSKKKRDLLYKLNKKTLVIVVLIGLCSLLGGWSMYSMFTKLDFSYIMPIIKPLQIILSVILGVYILKEKLIKS